MDLWAGDEGMMLGGRNPHVGFLGEDREGLRARFWQGGMERKSLKRQGWVWAEVSLSGLEVQVLPALFAAAEGRSFWHLFLLFTPNQLRGRAEGFAVCSLPFPSSRPSLLNPLYSLCFYLCLTSKYLLSLSARAFSSPTA